MALRCLTRMKLNLRLLQPLRITGIRNSSILSSQNQLFRIGNAETSNLLSIRLKYDKSGESSNKRQNDEDVSSDITFLFPNIYK